MQTITIDLPSNSEVKKAKVTIALALYEQGIFSTGQAADFLEISRTTFIEELGTHGLSVFGETEEDLLDLKNLNI